MNQASKLTKESIVEAYNQLVSHQGKLIGERVFMRETGISHYHWKGDYWRSWSAFQTDAGHEPNSQTQKIPDEVILDRFGALALELGDIPSEADIEIKRREVASIF